MLIAYQKSRQPVIWSCDPMHGNTQTTQNGYKTRIFKNIHDEVEKSFVIHEKMGTILGGVHLELTGEVSNLFAYFHASLKSYNETERNRMLGRITKPSRT